ncbi:MAG: hypothetical protein A2X08_10605 [Bacteroidetes bacterium GWA2_32_17]|nr:MAG: hypothetical protein A2X08_10605 [Bacteroidetes bacterium GWA2_32_17]
MVPLENRIDYSLRINEIPKLTAFNNLLLSKTVLPFPKQDLNESDEIYFELVNAIQKKDKVTFEKYYNKKNKSHPSKESPSPFVNDDFLIFCLLVGIVKFDLDKKWIKDILSIRSRSTITITLENIINENYYSKDNLHEIVLMYFQLNNPSLISNDIINNAFKCITANTALFESKSDFHILCSIRAYDLIIELKEAPDGSEINILRQFNTKFLKRIKVLAWFIQSIILFAIFYLCYEIVVNNPTAKEYIDKINSVLKVLGIIGLSQIGNLFPILKRKSYEIILRILGYPKALVKEINMDGKQ